MDVFSAIADPLRRELLTRLAAGPARVVDLAAEHPVSRPAVSRHLRMLTEAGLVVADDVGRERHYRLLPEPLVEVRAFAASLERRPPIPESALDALDTEVRRTSRERRLAAPTHTEESA
ncbi:metalloregulator ArsR/SmtB family transcription factor [Aeromicrobium sp. Leaf350]|uniref:ArsR/SmtB family transcription factor n=1 Tax=Aeromicrobium sp. Leaf350 TaxID=2876565 RepID=UPI001E6567E0|nr:metalloregulator ArsR/SmtB family transcription factor [Aeromicrobium sp. Leaf350]